MSRRHARMMGYIWLRNRLGYRRRDIHEFIDALMRVRSRLPIPGDSSHDRRDPKEVT